LQDRLAYVTEVRARTMPNGQPEPSIGSRAYVLIDVKEDSIAEVARYLRDDLGLATVDIINGPYHIVAVMEGTSISSLARTVVVDIRKLSAVRDIVVYMSEPEEKIEARIPVVGDRKRARKAPREEL
jgi:hypothetical protein